MTIEVEPATGKVIMNSWIGRTFCLLLLTFSSGIAGAQQLAPMFDFSDMPPARTVPRQPVSTPAKPPTSAPSTTGSGTTLLTGSVSTLEAAITEESNVDWYGWYMRARDYFTTHGGLSCQTGTPLTFYRNGYLKADNMTPACQRSLMGKRFPLPAATRLEAVVLPVRPGTAPPASREELLEFVRRR